MRCISTVFLETWCFKDSHKFEIMLGVSNQVTKDYLANWIVLLVMNNIMQKGRLSSAICPLMSARNTLALQLASQDAAKILQIKKWFRNQPKSWISELKYESDLNPNTPQIYQHGSSAARSTWS